MSSSEDLTQLRVSELRSRFASRAPDAATLDMLARDARAGVRELAARWKRRAERDRREQVRLAALYRAQADLAPLPGARIAGVDEVGMGPLAGPVVAAAVVLPQQPMLPKLDDSKRLRPDTRRRLAEQIFEHALAVSIGLASCDEIDRINIHQAGLLAMRRALTGLSLEPERVAVDGREVPGVHWPQVRCIGGDRTVACISAASVVAKEHRDELMRALDRDFPGYGFAEHMGYGTPAHLEALRDLGPCREHRRSFGPVRSVLEQRSGSGPCLTR